MNRGVLLLLCAVAVARAQVIDWENYCKISSSNTSRVSSAITGFTGKVERYKTAATDSSSKIFKDMVKVCMCCGCV